MKIKYIAGIFLLMCISSYADSVAPVLMTPAPIASDTNVTKTEKIPVIEEGKTKITIPKHDESGNKPAKIPGIPLEPGIKTGGVLEITKNDENGELKSFQNKAWKLTQNIRVYVNEKVHIFKPLEIKNDIKIGITVVGDEIVKAKFPIEFTEAPTEDKKYYYMIKYVDGQKYNGTAKEEAIKKATNYLPLDLDNDGLNDTLVYSDSPYIQGKIKYDNYIEVDGKNLKNYTRDENIEIGNGKYNPISRIDGSKEYKRQIYMVVEGNI